MAQDPEPVQEQPGAAGQAQEPGTEQDQEAGDFITRQVLEKDSVFFEG